MASVMQYIPFLLILLLYLLLFSLSHGTFDKTSAYLLRRIPALSSFVSKETLRHALLLIFVMNLLGAAVTWKNLSSDTVAQGYLMRNEYGQADEETELTVNLDGETQEVDLQIAARALTPKEIASALDEAGNALGERLFQESEPGEIRGDLPLPESIDVTGVPAISISWETSNPLLMDWNGLLGEEVPKEGAPVTLTARLTLEGQEKTINYELRVYPPILSHEERLRRAARAAVEDSNDPTEAKVLLPEQVEGMHAIWSKESGADGLSLLLLGILIAAMYAYSRIRKKELEEVRREEQMLIDYPNIVSKLVLLLAAGLSLRKAFARIRKDYRDSLSHGGGIRPGYEELARVTLEMEHGISELNAYENLGKRCNVPQYRTFATLLTQNLTKGGSEMAAILARDAEDAFEERKKRARVLGEQAGTKLLLPMLLMLVIVMAILMVPAFLTFF